jgi:hypothetical protein
MPSSQFTPNTVFDYLFDFSAGMDSGGSPLLLPKNQLAWGSNLTTRGDLVHPRPPRRILTLVFPDHATEIAVTKGLFQGYCYFRPDSGNETLMASISGRLYQFIPIGTTATVTDVTGGNPQSATALQCWLWQAEDYVFWNDGINRPVFFNGTTLTTARANPRTVPPVGTWIANLDIIPAQGTNFNIQVNASGPFAAFIGQALVVASGGQVTVVAIVDPTHITVTNNTLAPGTRYNGNFPLYAAVALTPQFPPGRMGCYVMGRVWMALADGLQFIAGDIVGGPSGTLALNFRDAILNITENNFIVGGGNFRVPGTYPITAMIGTATLDVSLGQGPLQVFTLKQVFSCNTPVDRTTWQNLQNPILTVSAIGNGATGQYSTFIVNSDTIFRSLDGIRSLILSRQDFNQWIRTPISHEVERLLTRDNQSLLPFGNGVFFDNRTLMTASPTATATQGVFNKALVALNSDLLTTVREKQPPAYDGAWPGMNIMGMMTGDFASVERCYQFCFNTVLETLELWELMPESAVDVLNNPLPIVGDNGTQAIEWWFETGSMGFGDKVQTRTFKQLINGEIFVDSLVGRVDFQAFYKPDQYPCWVPWLNWSECAVQNTGAETDNKKPGFKPRMGLGTPSATPCDPFTNRPFREFYTMQFKIVITGQCQFVGARFAAVVIPEPTFSPPSCSPVC